jgi:chemotaxis protein histidine kinase CheA
MNIKKDFFEFLKRSTLVILVGVLCFGTGFWIGQAYRLRYLNQILYGSDPVDALAHQSSSVPVIIIRTDLGQRMALQVDMIAGSRIEVGAVAIANILAFLERFSRV